MFIKQYIRRIDPLWLFFAFALFFIWNTPIVYPVKLFVVFLHEVSHGIAAILTGGTIEKIVIDKEVGGQAITIGGSRFVILSSGYLGSLIFGGTILVLSSKQKYAKYLSLCIAVLMLVITIGFVRNLFGLIFGLLFVASLLFTYFKLSANINRILLRSLGFASCIYVFLDIREDIFTLRYTRSDAVALAELTWIPSYIWGALWMIISFCCVVFFLALSSKK